MNKWKYEGHRCKQMLQIHILSTQMEKKKKWAQKMQNHLLAKLLSKIHSQLGFSFQNSVEYLPVWLKSIHWTQRENRAISKVREHSLCFPHTLCGILSMCLSWFDIQDRRLGSHWGHTVLSSCLVVLSTKEKSFLRNLSSDFIFLLLPGLISCGLLLSHFNITEFHKFQNSYPQCQF